MSFDDKVLVRTNLGTGTFKTKSQLLQDPSIVDGLELGGCTAMWDAAAKGLQALSRMECAEKILIVFTDGGDNASDTNMESVVAQVNGARKGTKVIFAGVGDGCGELERLRGASSRITISNSAGDDSLAVEIAFEEIADFCKLVTLDLYIPKSVKVGQPVEFILVLRNDTTSPLPDDAKIRLLRNGYFREARQSVAGLNADGASQKLKIKAQTDSEDLRDIKNTVEFTLEGTGIYKAWQFELPFYVFNAGLRELMPPVDKMENSYNILVGYWYRMTIAC